MKYCPKCKKLYMENENLCKECKKSVLDKIDDAKTPVFLCNVNASQREMVLSTLEENAIVAGYENQSENSGMSMEGFDILVPYGLYKKAYSIVAEMGMVEFDEDFYNQLEEVKLAENQEFEEMSPAKRTTVKLLSALALIILFALVIFGVDYVIEFIKNLLG